MSWKKANHVSSESYMKSYNIMKLGDIAFEGNKSKDFSFGRFVENTIGNGIVSHVFDVFRPIQKGNINFWKYLIHDEQIMRKKLARSTTSSTMMTNLVAKDFLRQKIYIPQIGEQDQIGALIESTDNLIVANER